MESTNIKINQTDSPVLLLTAIGVEVFLRPLGMFKNLR